jgi:sorting nexin-16
MTNPFYFQLGYIFPTFRLSLPPKKWFGNFNPEFLEERQLGLQAFLNNIVGHRDVANSDPVREFLCLDDPPGPHDSLEESRVSSNFEIAPPPKMGK